MFYLYRELLSLPPWYRLLLNESPSASLVAFDMRRASSSASGRFARQLSRGMFAPLVTTCADRIIEIAAVVCSTQPRMREICFLPVNPPAGGRSLPKSSHRKHKAAGICCLSTVIRYARDRARGDAHRTRWPGMPIASIERSPKSIWPALAQAIYGLCCAFVASNPWQRRLESESRGVSA